ncbi:hypothetical protein MMAN_13740 [Mycobacterium mantenii]|uniref:STAS domain-containing protein n=1 Tax=Mycobacterium mantenii TaxID=560555 RepID=A0A1X0G6R3_MYCNT|nr:hypothetical protein BST30_00970 [Mycobacterium mantenii]BBY37240.1 hypothetical protein MMAN_13740 [Mycobacterium mantenii]
MSPDNIVIDVTDAHIWDASSVATLDAITRKYESKGKNVSLNDTSAKRHAHLSPLIAGAH